MTFGEWIRSKREELGWRAIDCARRAGMSAPVWSDWENDRTRRKDGSLPQPTRATCARIARGLSVPTAEVLHAAGYQAAQKGMETRSLFLAYYSELPISVQEDVLVQVEALWRRYH